MHGYEIYFEPGTLVYQSGVAAPTLYAADGQTAQPQLSALSDPVACFAAELQAAVNGIESGMAPAELDGRTARRTRPLSFGVRIGANRTNREGFESGNPRITYPPCPTVKVSGSSSVLKGNSQLNR